MIGNVLVSSADSIRATRNSAGGGDVPGERPTKVPSRASFREVDAVMETGIVGPAPINAEASPGGTLPSELT